MTSKRYTGNIITDTPTDPTGDAAGGVWSLAEANAFKAGNAWPTLPEAPTIGTATDAESGGTVNVAFTAPELYGGTLSQYTATSNPSAITGTGTTSPISVSGLTNGTSYTFTVKATTGAGTGPESSASNSVAPSLPQIGVFMGGGTNQYTNSQVNTVDYIANIASTANLIDFGDLSSARTVVAGCGNASRMICAGGSSASTKQNTIDYHAFSSTGNFSDFGDLSVAREFVGGLANSTRGVICGGDQASGPDKTIDYITIASTGDATDFGDLIDDKNRTPACFSSSTRGVMAGGNNSNDDTIVYITIASTGNATDFGDMTGQYKNMGGCSSSTRGLYARWLDNGGSPSYQVDYVTIATTGNAADFGDLTRPISYGAACSSNIRGVFGSGNDDNFGITNVVDYVTIATLGDGTDFGDLTQSRANSAGTSNCHGGLQ